MKGFLVNSYEVRTSSTSPVSNTSNRKSAPRRATDQLSFLRARTLPWRDGGDRVLRTISPRAFFQPSPAAVRHAISNACSLPVGDLALRTRATSWASRSCTDVRPFPVRPFVPTLPGVSAGRLVGSPRSIVIVSIPTLLRAYNMSRTDVVQAITKATIARQASGASAT